MKKIIIFTVIGFFSAISNSASGQVTGGISILDPPKSELKLNVGKTRELYILPQYNAAIVCTPAKTGGRFANLTCVPNFREGIPINNSPAYRCEKVWGAGNCEVVPFWQMVVRVYQPDGTPFAPGSVMAKPDMPDQYGPKCAAGFKRQLGVESIQENQWGWDILHIDDDGVPYVRKDEAVSGRFRDPAWICYRNIGK